MLHESKRRSIVEWYNSLTPSSALESIDQLTDGSFLCDILNSITNFSELILSRRPDETSMDGVDITEKYNSLKQFIDESFHIDSESIISYSDCMLGKELELAKLSIFILTAIVQVFLSSKNPALNTLTLLEAQVQQDIEECLSLLVEVEPVDIRKVELHRILGRPAKCKGSPRRRGASSPSTPLRAIALRSTKNSLLEKGIQSSFKVEDSPLQYLWESPKLLQQAAIFSKDKEISKLRSNLLDEESKVADLKEENEGLKKDLEKKSTEIQKLKQKYSDLQQDDSLNECLKCKEITEDILAKKEISVKKINELEMKVVELEADNKVLQENHMELEKEHAVCENIKDQISMFSGQQQELNELKIKFVEKEALIDMKEKTIQLLESEIENLKTSASIYEDKLREVTECKDQTLSPDMGEKLGNIFDEEYRNVSNELKVKEQKISEIEILLKNKDENISEAENLLKNKDEKISEIGNLLKKKDERMSLLEKELSNKDLEIENIKAELESTNNIADCFQERLSSVTALKNSSEVKLAKMRDLNTTLEEKLQNAEENMKVQATQIEIWRKIRNEEQGKKNSPFNKSICFPNGSMVCNNQLPNVATKSTPTEVNNAMSTRKRHRRSDSQESLGRLGSSGDANCTSDESHSKQLNKIILWNDHDISALRELDHKIIVILNKLISMCGTFRNGKLPAAADLKNRPQFFECAEDFVMYFRIIQDSLSSILNAVSTFKTAQIKQLCGTKREAVVKSAELESTALRKSKRKHVNSAQENEDLKLENEELKLQLTEILETSKLQHIDANIENSILESNKVLEKSNQEFQVTQNILTEKISKLEADLNELTSAEKNLQEKYQKLKYVANRLQTENNELEKLFNSKLCELDKKNRATELRFKSNLESKEVKIKSLIVDLKKEKEAGAMLSTLNDRLEGNVESLKEQERLLCEKLAKSEKFESGSRAFAEANFQRALAYSQKKLELENAEVKASEVKESGPTVVNMSEFIVTPNDSCSTVNQSMQAQSRRSKFWSYEPFK